LYAFLSNAKSIGLVSFSKRSKEERMIAGRFKILVDRLDILNASN
jgi:hypothetical protein